MTAKIGISLPDDLVEWIRAEVKAGNAPSVSGLITDVLMERRERNELADLIAEMKAEAGEPTEEDIAWVDAAMDKAEAARRNAEQQRHHGNAA